MSNEWVRYIDDKQQSDKTHNFWQMKKQKIGDQWDIDKNPV